MRPREIVWRIIAPEDPNLAEGIDALLTGYEQSRAALARPVCGTYPGLDLICPSCHERGVTIENHPPQPLGFWCPSCGCRWSDVERDERDKAPGSLGPQGSDD
jgi:hypothetical protein